MATLKINDSGARAQYTASALQTNFSYPFEIFEDADLKVWQTAAGATPDPIADLLTLSTDYTVTNAGVTGGGDVVLNTGATLNDIITIFRDIPIERQFDYSVGGDFTGASINQQLDKLTMTQQQNESVSSEQQLTYSTLDELSSGDTTLPQLAIGQFWKKGSAGGLVAVTLDETAGWSALRSELANDLTGTDGALIVGHYSSGAGSTTVHDELERVQGSIVYYGATAGTEPAYEITIADFPGYSEGIVISLIIHSANTSSPVTLNVNGLAPIQILRAPLTALVANDLQLFHLYQIVYAGGYFFMQDIALATTALDGIVQLATVAEMKAESAVVAAVTPNVMKQHRGVAKAWVNFSGATPTVNKSYNITSVTKSSPGQYTVNFTNSMSDANYIVSGFAQLTGRDINVSARANTTSSIDIYTQDLAAGFFDPDKVSVMIFGELA